ncbi:hypothetical protein P43SY_008608 [Pythium insidiosum]|uniref:DUF547 domain-containing protein n=1 Tax=Pythium insidiosum TaxID=114742 RepID=A0AAD5M1C9_PYTIN|nr:hypothetical protein P43SY_008608 [Pythium insidiosum]
MALPLAPTGASAVDRPSSSLASTTTRPSPTSARVDVSPPPPPPPRQQQQLELDESAALRRIVTGASVAFLALVIYLSSVLYPLVVIVGAYVLVQQRDATDDNAIMPTRLWTNMQTRVSQLLSPKKEKATSGRDAPSPAIDLDTGRPAQLSTAPTAVAAATATAAAGPVPGIPKTSSSSSLDSDSAVSSPVLSKRDSYVPVHVRPLASAAASVKPGTPSLRVAEMAVDPNGSLPQAGSQYASAKDKFMKGKLLFLLKRGEQPWPPKYAPLFDGKRRLFWVQMQVQFKKVPSGILYIGGEVPRAMNLGFFTGGLTKIILSVLQSLVRGLHCSFGQLYPSAVKDRDDEELPHICFPLYTAVDQFVVTKPGETPPELGTADFGESAQSMAARRKSGQPMYQYNTTDTYSFHFHSFFIDFSSWRLVGIPGMKDYDLSMFWEDMPLRICAYSLKPQPGVDPNSETDAKKAVHSWRAKEYKFCVELSHKVQDMVDDEPSIDYEADECTADGRRLSEVVSLQTGVQEELQRFGISVPAWFEYHSTSPAHSERRVGYAILVREFNEPADGQCSRVLKAEHMVLHTAVTAFLPLSFLEHELMRPRRRGSGNGLFSGSKHKTLEESISVRSRSNRYSKIEDERQFLEDHLRLILTADMQTFENTRPEQLLAAQSALLELVQSDRGALSMEWQFLSSSFVRSNSFGSSTNVLASTGAAILPPKDTPHAAVQVVRAVTSTHWRHEWLTLDKGHRELRFFRMMASSSSFSISLDKILIVERDAPIRSQRKTTTAPFDSDDDEVQLFWLHIGLLEKCHHIAFATPEELQHWLTVIRSEVEGFGCSMKSQLQQPIMKSSEGIEAASFFTDSTSKSRGAKRCVLNDRCEFLLHAFRTASSSMWSPNDIVARNLKTVISLQRRKLDAFSTQDLIEFLDAVCALKWVNLSTVVADETERKVFFLNLYHLMLIHASVLGFLPKSITQWSKFFNGVSYNIGGMYFSIAEIEHGIIRAPMATLRIPIAFLVIPKISDQDERAAFRLTIPDFRLNFAMNCLTKSYTNAIIVYTTADIDKQLDIAMAQSVEVSLSYDQQTKVVFMPKLCEWYRADFSDATDTATWQQEVLSLLTKYLAGDKAQLFAYIVEHEDSVVSKWKFAKFDYRFHELLEEAAA